MERERVLGVMVDPLSLDQAVQKVATWMQAPGPCRYVVTPNLDHAVLLRQSDPLRQAYRKASLVIPDGMPMVWASRVNGGTVKERVAGSDLVPALLERRWSPEPLRIFLLGAAPGVAARAATEIHRRFPSSRVVGTHSPELGFERSHTANAQIIKTINGANAQLLVIGLGAPKQELWVHAHAGKLNCAAAVCAGATIDFLAGHRSRAPRWMQRTGTEWLYRALSEPRRLLPRYARDARHLPALLYSDWKAGRARPSS